MNLQKIVTNSGELIDSNFQVLAVFYCTPTQHQITYVGVTGDGSPEFWQDWSKRRAEAVNLLLAAPGMSEALQAKTASAVELPAI